MAELVLTEEEEKNPKWLALDPETVGKAVLAGASVIADFQKENSDLVKGYSAIVLLIWRMLEAKSDNFSIKLNGVTHNGKDIGDFELTLTRKD